MPASSPSLLLERSKNVLDDGCWRSPSKLLCHHSPCPNFSGDKLQARSNLCTTSPGDGVASQPHCESSTGSSENPCLVPFFVRRSQGGERHLNLLSFSPLEGISCAHRASLACQTGSIGLCAEPKLFPSPLRSAAVQHRVPCCLTKARLPLTPA